MPQINKSSFEQARDYALYFTIAAAVAYAIYWIISIITNSSTTGGGHTIGTVLLAAVEIGGVTMGILYAIRTIKK